MTRACVFLALLCLTACGSSSGRASSPSSSADTSTSSAPTTTRPVTTTTGVNQKVADGFTQLALSGAIQAAHTIYNQNYDYTTVTPESLAPLVPNDHFGTIDQASAKVIGMLAQDTHDVFFVMESPSGRWYCVTENSMDGVSYGEGHTRASVDSNGECQRDSWPPPGEGQVVF